MAELLSGFGQLKCLAGYGYIAASLEAMPADRGNPQRFHRLAKWKKVRDDFFRVQLEA